MAINFVFLQRIFIHIFMTGNQCGRSSTSTQKFPGGPIKFQEISRISRRVFKFQEISRISSSCRHPVYSEVLCTNFGYHPGTRSSFHDRQENIEKNTSHIPQLTIGTDHSIHSNRQTMHTRKNKQQQQQQQQKHNAATIRHKYQGISGKP